MYPSPKNRFSSSIQSPRGSALLRTMCGAAFAGALLGALPAARAASYTFTNGGGDNAYTNPANWSGGVVPNTSNGDIATIGNGSPVIYTPGGDLTIGNGGMLKITNGSFVQVVSPAYYQLAGNGSIIVNGGTFNQGSASSNPFNISGTGNAFTVSAGTANINSSFNMNAGLTFLQSGGAINVTGAETDFNSTANTLSGGIFNTALITGVNAPGVARFDISGGTLNLTGSGFNGIYAGGLTQYINFTLGSTGKITFSSGSTTVSDVQNFVNAGVIEYNSGGLGTLSSFNITSTGGVVTIAPLAVPEPSEMAFLAAGVVGFGVVVLRRHKHNFGV